LGICRSSSILKLEAYSTVDIVITGIGVISAAGGNLDETLSTFRQGVGTIGAVSLFPTALAYPVFEAKHIPERAKAHEMRTLRLALCAVEEALFDAELQSNLSRFRVGVCLGTTVASQLNDVEFYRSYRAEDAPSMRPVDRYLKGNLAEAVRRAIKVRGPSVTVVNACSSGADAIGVALSWLRHGVCDIALAGGADEVNQVPLCGFGALGILSDSICAPFDRDRTGLNLGEGAGVLVLESEEGARKRGSRSPIYLGGYGSAADAYHLTAPRPDGSGLEASLARAMSEAKIHPDDVCFVNAHGTATPDNDKVEGSVLRRVFGERVRFLSTKGFTGHTLGAAGGVEAAFTAAALRESWVPASAGFRHQDEEILLSPVTEITPIPGRYAISTSLGFGGNNAAIVIARRQEGFASRA
jgi:3-oxoacyl-(acyl-carrier-protein) synthase